MFAGLHHSVGLCDTQVDTGSINSFLALRCRLVLPCQFEMLLEVADTLLDQLLLIVKQTKLEGGVSLSLCFILGLSNIH